MGLLAPSVYPILRNARMLVSQRIQSRAGMQKIAGPFGAGPIHSIRRLNETGSFTRLVGSGGDLYLWTSTTPIDTGYSGNPLSLVRFRPPQSPQAWMYVGDAQRMRKVSVTGTNYEMGIAPPLTPPTVDLGVPAIDVIDDFDTVGSWVNGGTAGSLSIVSRFAGQSSVVIYDAGTTGWASIGLRQAGTTSAVQQGARFVITGFGGAPTESFTVQQIIPAALAPGASATILGISYDSGSTGPCTIVLSTPSTAAQANLGFFPGMDIPTVPTTGVSRAPTNNAVGIQVGSMFSNSGLHTASGFFVVEAVSTNQAGLVSIRANTAQTFHVSDTLVSWSCIRAYLVNNYPNSSNIAHEPTLAGNCLESTIGAGTGTISEVVALDLSQVAAQNLPIQDDDILHISFNIDDAANLVELRLVLDVDSVTNDFQHTYYFKSWQASDIQQALLGNTTIQNARQSSYSGQVVNANVGTVPGAQQIGPAVLVPPATYNDPAAIALSRGSNYPYASKFNPAGLGAWSELTCAVSDLTKVGPDATATLANVQGVRVQITVASDAVCAIDSAWIGGCYGPDIGTTGVPYLYRVQPRSKEGAKGYPGPPTRAGVEPYRQAVVIASAQHPDPQVTYLDVYRWGGSLPQWTYVNSMANSATPSTIDSFGDLDIASAQQLSFDNLQPFPTIDNPKAGVCNVVGSTVTWVSGDAFNVNWAQGAQINIAGTFYTFYAQPSSISRVEIVENAGVQTAVSFTIAEATLLGQPLPAMWGPYSQGTALYLFACGDTYQPGVLFLTNGNDADSASDIYQIEITSPSEPLMNGCMYNGQSYVFSSDRLFSLYPTFGSGVVLEAGNLLPSEGTNLFTPLEVPNGKGLFARFAICVGPAIWFRGRDGIYETTGGAPTNITTAELALLFPHADQTAGEPVTVGTFTIYPPDDTLPNKQTMAYANSHVYYTYQDTQGNMRTLAYNTDTKTWAWDDHTPQVASIYAEEGQSTLALLQGSIEGNLWQAAGDADGNGSAFPFECRMPQLSELVGGFQHVRDGYLGLQDSSQSNLVINVDGQDNVIVLPSVSGEYERVYTPTPALKGRLFAFALLGTAPFNLFQRDCQISCKTWADPEYKPINSFASTTRAMTPKVQ